MQDKPSSSPVPVWLLGFTLLPFSATAQQTDENASVLDTVTITGQAATKTDTPFIETPQSVSLITREDMEEKGVQSVQEAADYTAGVFTNQYGASSRRYDALALRGFTSDSIDNIYLDGLKLLSDKGTYSIMQVDPYFLEQIEIVKGPASVLYGRASPGGLVALTSKQPLFQPYHQVQASIGTQGHRSTGFDFSNQLGDSGRVAYRLVGLAKDADSQFDKVESERYALAPSLAIDIGESTSLTLMAYLQNDPEGGYYGGLPAEGMLYPHAGRYIPRDAYDGEPDYEKFERRQTMLGYQLSHQFNDVWSAQQNVRYVDASTDYGQVYSSAWVSNTELSRAYFGAEEELEAYTIDNQLQASFSTGAIEHTVLLGLDYQHRQVDSEQSLGSFPAIDIFDPEYGAEGTISPYADIDRKLEQTGVYLQDQIAFGNWRFTLGGREDWVDITNQTNGEELAGDYSKFSGRAGALYLFDNGVAPYLSYSESFNPSSNADENGNLLEPTEGKQYEAGLKYQPLGTQDRYSLALFNIQQKNVSEYIQETSAYRAVGEVESQGIELEARKHITDQFRLDAGYTYTDVTYEKEFSGNEGNTANTVPRHMASLWGNYGFDQGALNGLDVGVGVRYTGESWADRENTEKVSDYTLVDAGIQYDMSHVGLQGVAARVDVDNLLDEEYVAACYSLARCYFGAERSVRATLSYNF